MEFKNVSGHDCSVSGFAGVDLKTNSGSPCPAKRTGRAGQPDTLKNGKSVYFGVTYPPNDSGGSGVRVTGLLVTPPGETKSVTLAWPGARHAARHGRHRLPGEGRPDRQRGPGELSPAQVGAG